MRIALDGMGGDHAPQQTVKGAVEFVRDRAYSDHKVVLVGEPAALEAELRKYSYDSDRIDLVPASQVVAMDEKPARIVKTKPDSSLVKAVTLVRDKQADGIVSAGSTGALLAASLFLLKRIPGVRRPAICPYLPSESGGFVICDAGANVDVRPSHLVQFALMASAYSQHLFGLPSPRIGLLNIGTEATKGNEITVEAYKLLREGFENFVGNVEARDLFNDVADVVVCDGFVGNILVKFGEGLVRHLVNWGKDTLKKHPISMLSLPLMRPALKDLGHQLDHEETGGWPLLGLNGISIVCHGSSNAKAIKNALISATRCVTENLIESIASGIKEHLDLFKETNERET